MERDEWLKQRYTGLGGSDAACVIGKNPWKTNLQLWEEKTGRRKEKDISDRVFVRYGHDAEQPLRDLFVLDFPQYEVEHTPYDILRHDEYTFLLASLDGVLTDRQTGEKGILEIKTANIVGRQQRSLWDGRVPDPYYIQCLHYLLVTGYSFAVLKAQLKSEFRNEVTITTRHYTFTAKETAADILYLKRRELEFWEYVRTDTPPPLILPDI